MECCAWSVAITYTSFAKCVRAYESLDYGQVKVSVREVWPQIGSMVLWALISYQRIDSVTFNLHILEPCCTHPVFHTSHLKKKDVAYAVEAHLPTDSHPLARLLTARSIGRHGFLLDQILAQWKCWLGYIGW